MSHICGEIQYEGWEGTVHSDICVEMDAEEYIHEEARKFLHDNLDEWINRSGGTGAFYIGDIASMVEKS